ncbi:hypothetical protein [Anaeromyxobacter terrae]|uniref:hypothetical protein n=1 Tax=Anaeromyxobacter terrae TaxID=2925406 RepID=UPI001F58242A|nr:hypothetical protein [Anaeromyxobacter sp. SG22]
MHRNPLTLLLAVALLAACAGGSDGSTSGPLVVTGSVVGSDRLPVEGARVATRTADGWRSTTSDVQGAFALQVDGVPYDLAVVRGDQVDLYLGVTRTNPQARLALPAGGLGALGATFTTTITGDCGGAGCPPAGYEGNGQLTFTTGTAYWFGTAQPPGSAGTYNLAWMGPAGTLFAMYWACPGTCAASAPGAFWLARQDAVALRAGVTTDLPALALAPLPTAPLGVNLTAPQGVSPQAMMGFALGTPAAYWLHAAGPAAPGAHTFLVPLAQDLRTMVYVTASPGGGAMTSATCAGTTPTASVVDLALRAVPSLLEPLDGATLGAGTRFAWSSEPGAVHVLGLVSSTTGAPDFHVTTTAQTFEVPDLSALGITVPAGAAYTWSVRSQPTTVDGRLAPTSTAPIPPSQFTSSWSTQSATRTATVL